MTWDQIQSAGNNLTLSNAGFTTTFNQTSNVAWLWDNTTTATALTTNASPLIELAASYWTGAASAQDTWTIGTSLAAGTNAISTLSVTHSGSTGAATINLPGGTSTVPSITFNAGVTNVGFLSIGGGFLAAKSDTFNFYATNSNLAIGQITLSTTNGMSIQNTSGNFLALSANTSNATVWIGCSTNFASTSGTVTCVGLGNNATMGASMKFSPTSGNANFIGLGVFPTINQTGTASGSYTALQINSTETAVLGTSNKLFDAQVGSVSKFAIDNTGKVVVPSTNTATSATAGANGAVPSQVVGYLIINVNGTNVKVPYFNT